MKYWILYSIILILACTITADSPSLKKSINFGINGENNNPLLPEEVCTYSELKIWATFNGFTLDRDHNGYGLNDGVCRVVQDSGVKFYLIADTNDKRPLNLYLDFTVFTKKLKTHIQPRNFKILVNNLPPHTITIFNNTPSTNPYKITLHASDFQDGLIHVHILPASIGSGGMLGIWDVYYSYY